MESLFQCFKNQLDRGIPRIQQGESRRVAGKGEAKMKMIINGIECVADMNCTSSAGSYTFASIEDVLRCHNSDQVCGYCEKTFRPVFNESVNGKVCCSECRMVLIPPICAYFDRHRRVHDARVSDRPMSYAEYSGLLLNESAGKGDTGK